MDYQFALWQILYLMISPQKVFRDFQYRKNTKDQFARDDPAFLILLIGMISISSIAFAFTLHLGILGFLKFLLWSALFDCIILGIVIATLFWFVTNRYMIDSRYKFVDVEWAYAFDVHLNALFPLLLILHGILLPFISLILNYRYSHMSTAFGNVFWLVASAYYIYITFIGYNTLPYIKNSRIILTPFTLLICLYIFSVIFNWNATAYFVKFYYYRL
ncbi:unnamed protein product [Gordionus sp. m RMFG-2023]